jgi:N-acetylglucosaminyldiphosphoundecaprenol N-acetyl-beta-D-mannosaminyltransferase
MEAAEVVTPMEKGDPKSLSILGVKVHNITTDQALVLVERYMGEPGLHQVATVNPEFVMAAQNNVDFRVVLNSADLCIPDGVGLILAARWLGSPLQERVAGSDLVYSLASLAAEHGWRLFLLGSAPGVADQAADLFQKKYPQLRIAGTYSGSPALEENADTIRRVNESGADMLYVAYGAPAQDLWIARNAEALQNVRLAIGVGGSLDFVTGRVLRAPSRIQKMGLEWLYRLFKEPWRWKRMSALPQFAIRVLWSRKYGQ